MPRLVAVHFDGQRVHVHDRLRPPPAFHQAEPSCGQSEQRSTQGLAILFPRQGPEQTRQRGLARESFRDPVTGGGPKRGLAPPLRHGESQDYRRCE